MELAGIKSWKEKSPGGKLPRTCRKSLVENLARKRIM
jgi:hypothetical protein